MQTLYLYTTLGCHLCEEAKTLAWPLLQEMGYCLQEVEIADDPALMERYSLRIPVVATEPLGKGLGWPFNQAQLAALLAAEIS